MHVNLEIMETCCRHHTDSLPIWLRRGMYYLTTASGTRTSSYSFDAVIVFHSGSLWKHNQSQNRVQYMH
jgi:hypothetical protein